MTAKTEASRFSDAYAGEEAYEYPPEGDGAHVTLARALEDALAARDASFRYRNEIMEELERFRAAVREDLGIVRAKKRRFDAQDALAALGVVCLSAGIAVAFHWAYSLIVVGLAFTALGVLTSRVPLPPTG